MNAMFYVVKPERNSAMDGNKPSLEDNIKKYVKLLAPEFYI
jgi:hypothetical protein